MTVEISTLSKSYPYLSLSRQLGMSYDDVLVASDLFQPRGSITTQEMSRVTALVRRLQPDARRAIAQTAAAIANGEIGHGD